MRNLRIENEESNPTFVDEWGAGSNWDGENIHLTGSGTHDAPSSFETVTGSNAESPNTDYAIWTPQKNGDSGSGGSDGSTATATATGHRHRDGDRDVRFRLVRSHPGRRPDARPGREGGTLWW